MNKIVSLTIHFVRTFPIDDELLEVIPDLEYYTDEELIDLCKDIWAEHIHDDLPDFVKHIHGEVINE